MRKLTVSHDISQTGLTEEEYRILENRVNPELNQDDELLDLSEE
ncbi:hypothetical protein [Neobacillus massiliamazoniensis]|nr:hypothetical protein [Neobacillus massiliamazoniensis]